MKKIIIFLFSLLFTVSSLNAFVLNFGTGATIGFFSDSAETPTNGITVSLVSFEGSGFTPIAGNTGLSDIMSNITTTFVSGDTISSVINGRAGTIGMTSLNFTTNFGEDLYLFANLGGSEFGLWSDIVTTGEFAWISGSSSLNTDIRDLSSTATFTSFAGSFTDSSDIFILEVIPEPSTYALMMLGGLALVFGYGRKRRV